MNVDAPDSVPDAPKAPKAGSGVPDPSRCFPSPRSALGLYAILTVALTWPLALHLGDRLPEGNNDLWQNYWNFSWWKVALVERNVSPYATDLIYQPGPVSLAVHTHSPANTLGWLPVAVLGGESMALNLALLFGFLMSAWGTYFLARELVGDNRAGFIAGLVAAFTAQHFEQSLEHLNLASYQAMPFFLFFLVRLLRQGGWRYAILTGIFFGLNALYSWHNGLLIVPAAGALVLTAAWRPLRARASLLKDLAISATVSALLAAPFLLPLLASMARGERFQKAPVSKGIDALFLFVPPQHHAFLGSFSQTLYERWRTYSSVGFTCYLGVVGLALALVACLPRQALRTDMGREEVQPDRLASRRLWGGLFLGYLLLACGRNLTVAGATFPIPMPFSVLSSFPLFETLRVANRFVIPAALALSVLVAWGGKRLLAQGLPLGCCRLSRGGLLTLLSLLVALDMAWVPFPTRELPRPPWLAALEQAPSGLLLNVPGGHRARGALDLYLQTLHRRPLVGGYTSVLPEAMRERVATLPFLQMALEGRPQVNADVASSLKQVLDRLPVRVVAVHRDRERELLVRLRAQHAGSPRQRLYNPEKGMPAARLEATRATLRNLWGDPFYADAKTELFARP